MGLPARSASMTIRDPDALSALRADFNDRPAQVRRVINRDEPGWARP